MSATPAEISLSLAAVASIGLIGAATIRAIDRHNRLSPALCVSLCVPVGVVVQAFLSFLVSWSGAHLTNAYAAGVTAVSAVVVFATKPKWSRPIIASGWAGRAMLAVCLGLLLIWSYRVFVLPMHAWDGLATWGYKARVIHHETIGRTGYFLTGPDRSHLAYPLLVPLNMAYIASWVGSFEDDCVRAIFPFLAVSGAGLIYAGLAPFAPAAVRLVLAVSWMICPAYGQRATYAEADLVFVVLEIACIVVLVQHLQTRHVSPLILAGILAAGAGFTKNEGLPLCAMLIIYMAVYLFRREVPARSKLTQWFLFACVIGGMLAPWLYFRADLPKTDENYPAHLRISVIAENIDRTPTILRALGGSLVSFDSRGQKWFLLWPIAILGILRLTKSWESPGFRISAFVFIGQLLVYITAYVIYPGPIERHLEVTVDRLVLHLSGPAILLVGFGLAPPFSALNESEKA